MTLNQLLQQYCTCCYSPSIDIREDDPPQRVYYPYRNLVTPVTQTAEGVEVAPVDVNAHQQESVKQPQLHPVLWQGHHHTPVDLQGITEVHTVVKRPDDIRQENVYAVGWSRATPPPNDIWGSDKVWEEDDEEEDKELPLPWEGCRGPVLFDEKTVGPSWAQKEDDLSPPRQQQQQQQGTMAAAGSSRMVSQQTDKNALPVQQVDSTIKNPKEETKILNPGEEVVATAPTEQQQQQGDKTEGNKKKQVQEAPVAPQPYKVDDYQEPAIEPPRKEEIPVRKEEPTATDAKEKKPDQEPDLKKPEEAQAEAEASRPTGKNDKLDELQKGNLIYHKQEKLDYSKPAQKQQPIVGSATEDDKEKPATSSSTVEQQKLEYDSKKPKNYGDQEATKDDNDNKNDSDKLAYIPSSTGGDDDFKTATEATSTPATF